MAVKRSFAFVSLDHAEYLRYNAICVQPGTRYPAANAHNSLYTLRIISFTWRVADHRSKSSSSCLRTSKSATRKRDRPAPSTTTASGTPRLVKEVETERRQPRASW